MNSKVWRVVLVVFLTFGLSVLVVEQIHAAVTCSVSASAGETSASGSVSPGISDLEFDHEPNDKYEGKGTVSLTVDGVPSGKREQRIWIKVKSRTNKYTKQVERSATLEAGMEVGVNWTVINTKHHSDGSKTVKYTIGVEITETDLYTVSRNCSASASGDPWDYKDAYAFGNCGSAADADGLKTYRYTPGLIYGFVIGLLSFNLT